MSSVDFISCQTIRSVLYNDPGFDEHEFVEITGAANLSLEDIWIIELDGDGSRLGLINRAWDLSGETLGSNGLLLLRQAAILPVPDTETTIVEDPTMAIQNGDMTLLIVDSFYAVEGFDIDTNDDGVVDTIPWLSTLDGIGFDADNADPDLALEFGFVVINDNGGQNNNLNAWYGFSEDSFCSGSSSPWRGARVTTSSDPDFTYQLSTSSWYHNGNGVDCPADSARGLTPGVTESPLPFLLRSFTYKVEAGRPAISWELAIPQGLYIRLQRRRAEDSSFKDLVTLSEANESGRFLDDPGPGIHQYRLIDEELQVLETLRIELTRTSAVYLGANRFQMPNTSYQGPLYLFDMFGKMIEILNQDFILDLNHLPAGLYTIVYFHDGQKVYEKIQVF